MTEPTLYAGSSGTPDYMLITRFSNGVRFGVRFTHANKTHQGMGSLFLSLRLRADVDPSVDVTDGVDPRTLVEEVFELHPMSKRSKHYSANLAVPTPKFKSQSDLSRTIKQVANHGYILKIIDNAILGMLLSDGFEYDLDQMEVCREYLRDMIISSMSELNYAMAVHLDKPETEAGLPVVLDDQGNPIKVLSMKNLMAKFGGTLE